MNGNNTSMVEEQNSEVMTGVAEIDGEFAGRFHVKKYPDEECYHLEIITATLSVFADFRCEYLEKDVVEEVLSETLDGKECSIDEVEIASEESRQEVQSVDDIETSIHEVEAEDLAVYIDEEVARRYIAAHDVDKLCDIEVGDDNVITLYDLEDEYFLAMYVDAVEVLDVVVSDELEAMVPAGSIEFVEALAGI